MKGILAGILRRLARAILAKYHPTIIGITGSVGKTSTKEAVFCVLQPHTSVRRNLKSYNNEFGIPLTIIGAESGYRSPFRWFGIVLKGMRLVLFVDSGYPKTLVLEMGVDRPGEMAAHIDLAQCSIAVVTAVAAVHTEYFGTVKNVLEEKAVILASLPATGTAVLNADDRLVRSLASQCQGRRVVTYGFSQGADVRAEAFSYAAARSSGPTTGLTFRLCSGSASVPITLHGALGKHQVMSALAAAAVGIISGMTLQAIARALEHFEGPAGRMRLLPGIKRTMLIDDTYNASPRSTLAALETLKEIPGYGRRIACLGDMAELGQYSEAGHAEVGERAAELRIDFLITVGALGREIANAARRHGMPASAVFSFDQSDDAGRFLQDRMRQNDLVLIKGSQSIRMERIVKEVMAEPERAVSLLVRQEPSWLAKP